MLTWSFCHFAQMNKLPKFLFFEICKQLDYKTILALLCSNRKFRKWGQQAEFWECLAKHRVSRDILEQKPNYLTFQQMCQRNSHAGDVILETDDCVITFSLAGLNLYKTEKWCYVRTVCDELYQISLKDNGVAKLRTRHVIDFQYASSEIFVLYQDGRCRINSQGKWLYNISRIVGG